MKINKSIFVLIGLLCLLSWMAYSPSMVLAAKNEMGKPNAAFDVNKMGDMSDFDPANPWIPTGDVIKIGQVSIFSGPGAINGESHWLPMAWAVHDINKRGGIMVDGKKKLVALIKADGQGKPDQTKKVAERMVLEDKVQFLVGTTGSGNMKVLNEVGNKYKVIVMNEGSLADDLMSAVNFGPYAFMPSATTGQIGRGMAYYYGQIRKKEKKFYIICQDYSFGHELGEGFKKGLKEYYPEAQVVGEDYHKINNTDFAPYLEKIKASGAEVIYTGDFTPDSGNLLKQARQMGVKIPFANLFMNDPNELHDIGVETTKGLVNIDWHNVFPAFKFPAYAKYHKIYHDQWLKWKTAPYNTRFFEHNSVNSGAYGMDMYWLLSVIERAKSTDPEKIIKVWENDTYQFANGHLIKMRACDHKAVQDLLVSEYVPWKQQKASFNIPPYYWFQGCTFSGPGAVIPAGKVLPPIDPQLDRCKGTDGWGE